jgi:hypothetical protein
MPSNISNDVKDKTDITLPKGFDLNYFDDYMQITRVWHGLQTYALLLFSLIFNGVWIGNGFVEILFSERELLPKLFSLVFPLLGLGLLYFTIATWLNKTQIYVSKNSIEVKHKPVPWFGSKRIKADNIEQFFVEEKYKGSSNGNPRYLYNVLGLTSESVQVKLISGLEYRDHARYIEKTIEDYLGIENVKVEGEAR